jgi:hypothetical protein
MTHITIEKEKLEGILAALESLSQVSDYYGRDIRERDEIVFLKAALAQDEASSSREAQEPVVFFRCNGCGHAYEQVHPTSCDCMEVGGFDRVEYYTTPPAAQPAPAQTDSFQFDIDEDVQLLMDRDMGDN